MCNIANPWVWVAGFLLLSAVSRARAGEVDIVRVEFQKRGAAWYVSTTLKHDDTGWAQYADAWRVVTEDGRVLGTRVLYHPHETEQPFTRGLGGVKIPEGLHVVWVEAHCKVHGWSPKRLRVDLRQAVGTRYRVRR